MFKLNQGWFKPVNVAHFRDRTTGHPYEPEEAGIGDQE